MCHDRQKLAAFIVQPGRSPARQSDAHARHTVADDASVRAVGGIVSCNPHLMSTYIADKQSIILQKISQFQQGSGDGKWLVFFQTVTENILLNSFFDGLIPIILRFLTLVESATQLPLSH